MLPPTLCSKAALGAWQADCGWSSQFCKQQSMLYHATDVASSLTSYRMSKMLGCKPTAADVRKSTQQLFVQRWKTPAPLTADGWWHSWG